MEENGRQKKKWEGRKTEGKNERKDSNEVRKNERREKKTTNGRKLERNLREERRILG